MASRGSLSRPPPASSIPASGRQNEYFIPRDGIDRHVITSDICRYLGNDALVRPGTYESTDGKVTQGYFILAYRNLTQAMVQDLKADSARWEQEMRALSRSQQGVGHDYHSWKNRQLDSVFPNSDDSELPTTASKRNPPSGYPPPGPLAFPPPSAPVQNSPGPAMSTSDGQTTSMGPPGAATDSGYASMSQEPTKLGTAILQPIVESTPMDRNADETPSPEIDTATIYSAAENLDDYHLNVYESELADGLANWVRMLHPDTSTKETVANTLPDTLRDFALRLGQYSTTQSENEVMYFVHRYRYNIARRFREAILATAYDNDVSPKPQEVVDKVKLRVSVQKWLEKIADEPSLVDDVQEDPSAQPDEQEVAAIPDEQKYRKIAFKSPAYMWLLASLSKNVSLSTVSSEDAIAAIRNQITNALPRAKAVSSKTSAAVYAMTIRCDCDIAAFIRREYPETAVHGEFRLGNVISITGSSTDAQALTFLAYMEQTWPSTGSDVLSVVQRTVQSGKPESGKLCDRTRITAYASDDSLALEVEGTADVIAELAEQIIWLAATLRSNEVDELTFCTPYIKRITISDGERQADVGFDLSTLGQDQKLNGTCWYAMFRRPVIVKGYPIRKRPQSGNGLELPLHIMAGLIRSHHVTEFLGRSYIKGFASMLVAVDHTDGVYSWHHFHNSDGTRISYSVADNASFGPVSAHTLSTSRHIVGWCANASVLAGSSSSNYQVKRSGLPQAGRDFALDKIALSCGQIITGGVTFSIGKKDVPIHVSKGGYVEKLRWITQRHVVFWDVEDKRGWMVDGSTALHHLLRSSLEHSRTDSFRSKFLFDFSKLKDGSAIEVLLNPDHHRLLLYPSREETHTETVTGEDGETKTETKTKTSYTTLGNKVEELYTYLERMIEHKSQIENTKGLNAKVRLRRHLEGWDFSDLTTSRDPSHLRVATLPASAFSWVELTRIAQAVTLFGKGFGELLSPATDCARIRCSGWRSVPAGEYYLCVRLADLHNIIEDAGGDISTYPIFITPELAWINPSRNDPFGCVLCDKVSAHMQTPGKHPCPVQQLIPSSWRRIMSLTGGPLSLTSMEDGAVIFGQGTGFHWTWSDDKEGAVQPQTNNTSLLHVPAASTSSPTGTSTTSTTNDSSSLAASHTGSSSVTGASPLTTPQTPLSSQPTPTKGTPKPSETTSNTSSSESSGHAPTVKNSHAHRPDTAANPPKGNQDGEISCTEPGDRIVLKGRKGGVRAFQRAFQTMLFWRR